MDAYLNQTLVPDCFDAISLSACISGEDNGGTETYVVIIKIGNSRQDIHFPTAEGFMTFCTQHNIEITDYRKAEAA